MIIHNIKQRSTVENVFEYIVNLLFFLSPSLDEQLFYLKKIDINYLQSLNSIQKLRTWFLLSYNVTCKRV